MSSALRISTVGFPAALTALVVARKLYVSLTSPLSEIPGPQDDHWLWGHEMFAFEKPYEDTYTDWIESFGTTYKIKGALFHPDILVTADPRAIAHIFGKETYSYVKTPAILPLIERILGRSIFWAEGHTHKRHRHQLAPYFTAKATQSMFEVVRACAHTGAERLAAHVAATAEAKHEARLDIMDWTGRATLDIIGHVAFDHDFGSGESEDAKAIQRSWKNQIDEGLQKMGFVGSVLLRAFPFITRLPLEVIKSQEKVKATIHRIGRLMLERGPDESRDNSLLSNLARLKAAEDSSISDQELLDHIATMTVAGNETTALSIGYAFYELARNPDSYTRLQEEIAQLGHEPTYEDYTDGMPWLDAIVKETLRLYPPASQLERTALKDDILKLQTPLKGTKGREITQVPIMAGQLIRIPMLSLGYIKPVWGKDAAEFKPERWLDGSKIPRTSDTFQGWNGLMAFSAGPRMCIGYRLAVLEFKVILATYARRFKLRDTGAIIQTRFVGTLQPFVVGEETQGRQLPLGISLIDGEF